MQDSTKINVDIDYSSLSLENIADHISSETRSTKFPVEAFPELIQNVINDTNDSLNYPKDFTGVAILFAAAVAIGNKVYLRVNNGWIESAIVWFAIVGRPGSNKSAPAQFGVKPILDKDQLQLAEYRRLKKVFDEHNAMSRKERIDNGIPDPIKPVFRKSIVSDITPEALAEVHFHNQTGIGSYCDELAGWIKCFERYHKGNDQEFWLSVFSRKPLIIDRKSSEPILIQNPCISVCGTIQHALLHELARNNRGQNGFTDRILFAFPEDAQKQYWSETELSPDIEIKYKAVIDALHVLPITTDEHGGTVSHKINFSPEAFKTLKAWQRENTDKANHSSESEAGIYAKLEIYAIRLSLILQGLRYACGEDQFTHVGTEAVNGALLLIKYFENTALKVLSITKGSPIDALPLDKQQLYNALPASFSTAEGLTIAEQLGVNERTYKRFIKEEVFKNSRHGYYEKVI